MAKTWEDCLSKNANKKRPFVRWYIDSNRTKESYDKEIKHLTVVEYETAINTWLLEDEVQQAIKEYLKCKKNIDIINIYNAMKEKALEGDVASAKWIMDFVDKSGFFGSEEVSEIDKILKNLNVNEV
ncbi:hypothetical protein [Clostridium cylindrosporum]|uniref:Uncharacterized protein n=1 Tax=Clostridium cylindrosporum DSM 605 TaxID=1121307 RepID=A0A0J8DB53_CLOCY|nr:hypothetical protein [Clostridium cylindrosporum]KMT21508.1 hypothetical protein CLCY_2c02690 [Clostridium cylindrosporum DSM 605]